MISLLDATPASVMEVLRGERATRPPADCTAAPGVRATLEDALFSSWVPRCGPNRSH